MTITMTLPDVLAAKLKTEAHSRNRSAEEVAIGLLDQALDGDLDSDLDELVAKIKALPFGPALVRQSMDSLENYLARSLAEEAEMANYLLDANHASPLVTRHHRLRRRVFNEISERT